MILKHRRTLSVLAEAPFAWENGRDYALKIEAAGKELRLFVDGRLMLTARDEDEPYLTGCCGLALEQGSRCRIERFVVE